MKYINSEKGLVIFSESFVHAEVAQCLRINPTSAGFVFIEEPEKISCGGRSLSLGLSSHPDDTEKLRRELNRY